MSTLAMTWGPRPQETAFGYHLGLIREERAWTVERLALHCRVSKNSMNNWVLDGFEPLLSYAFKVACALGVELDDLADPGLAGCPERRRPDAPQSWTFDFKGAVGSTKFGLTLRSALAADGRTIKDFARDIGVERNAVSKWTLDRTEPRLTSAMRAAEELELSLHGLCSGEVRMR